MTVTRIATSDATTVTVRGRNLVDELVGRHSFTEMLYFLMVGRMPGDAETRVLDACLVTLMEHGLNPSTLITRLMADSVPDQIQVAIGAGLMAIGDVFAGTMEGCARLLIAGVEAADQDAFCRDVAVEYRAKRLPVPGFGHRTHKPDDPRTPRLLAVLAEQNRSGRYVTLLHRLATQVDIAAGRHITINATGAIAAALLEVGFPPDLLRAVAATARAGGLAGHVAEERQTGSARAIWDAARETIRYQDPSPH
jgi:citrate synthase